MPLPAGTKTVTVTGTYEDLTGAGLGGSVTFTPDAGPLTDAGDKVFFEAAPVMAPVVAGALSVVLPCTDQWSPGGWAYEVTENLRTGTQAGTAFTRSYFLNLPSSLGASADLTALVPLSTAPQTVLGGGTVAGNLTVTGTLTALGTVAIGLAPSGDGTGVTDTANIQGMYNLGASKITLAAGTFYVTGLQPVSFSRLTGQGRGVTTIAGVGANPVFDIGHAQTDTVEIDHLTLSATGADIFGGATVNAIRWYLHDNQFVQNGAGSAIWNGQIPSTTGVMIECRFRGNTWHYHGATRTAEACVCVGSSGANAINQNSWEDEIFFNDDADASMYAMRITATTQVNNANEFVNVVFEHPYGGMIKLESHCQGLIDQCMGWDLTGTVAQHLISVSKSAGGGNSLGNTIRNSPRPSTATFNAGIKDIVLDANCPQTMITNPASAGAGLLIDTGGSAFSIQGLPGTFTLTNGPTVPGRTILQSGDTATNSVLTVRNSAAAPAQPPLQVENANGGENAVGVRAHGDTANRLKVLSDGKMSWGPGNATQDVNLYRLSAGTLKTDNSLTVGGTFTSQAASLTSAPTAPAATASTTLVMAGLGTSATGTPWAITPASSGKVLAVVTGLIAVATGVASVTYGGRFGTGAAPVNGAAVTGTRFGGAGDCTVRPAVTGVGVPFALTAVLALTPATAYWLDLAIDTANASDAASLADVSVSLVEIQ